ncbi:uncharacterized protein LOC142054548 isoform X2 [Phalacrocorax aristotelis]|uniref:uncharacterized protein LOC142054548 isoform X2 n=1 Tax=Phalacrocorax aristotelis TaxID=126867 RepID=UPI003F4C0741
MAGPGRRCPPTRGGREGKRGAGCGAARRGPGALSGGGPSPAAPSFRPSSASAAAGPHCTAADAAASAAGSAPGAVGVPGRWRGGPAAAPGPSGGAEKGLGGGIFRSLRDRQGGCSGAFSCAVLRCAAQPSPGSLRCRPSFASRLFGEGALGQEKIPSAKADTMIKKSASQDAVHPLRHGCVDFFGFSSATLFQVT